MTTGPLRAGVPWLWWSDLKKEMSKHILPVELETEEEEIDEGAIEELFTQLDEEDL